MQVEIKGGGDADSSPRFFKEIYAFTDAVLVSFKG